MVAALAVPWQHWAVIAEQWFSLLLLARYIDRGVMRYSGARALWILWDVAFFGLFVWGLTALNWAGTIFILLSLLGLWGMVQRFRTKREYTWEGEEAKDKAVNTSIIIGVFGTLLVVLA